MTMATIKIAGADFSANRVGYFPGVTLLSPFALYLLGSGFGAPSNAEMYDWSGNGRTLTKTGTTTVNSNYYAGSYANYYTTPFDETALSNGAAGVTLVSISRGSGALSGSSQIVGNIPTDARNYVSLQQTSTNMQAAIKGATASAANRPLDTGKFGSWSFVAGRFAPAQLDVNVYRSDLVTTQKQSTTISAQVLTSTNPFKIGSSDGSQTATRDIAAIGFYNSILSDTDLDKVRDMLVSLLGTYGLSI